LASGVESLQHLTSHSRLPRINNNNNDTPQIILQGQNHWPQLLGCYDPPPERIGRLEPPDAGNGSLDRALTVAIETRQISCHDNNK